MTTVLRPFAALILALAASACAMMAPAPVKFADGMLVDSGGMTLYTFDRDTVSGKSACNGPCAALWPPLKAGADARDGGDWSVVTRDDGAKQWAYKGKPVYTYAKDQKAGEKTGDGFNNVWHIVKG